MNSATQERLVAVPVVQGCIRMRGNAQGWLYDNPAYASTTARVRAELAIAARSDGVEPTTHGCARRWGSCSRSSSASTASTAPSAPTA